MNKRKVILKALVGKYKFAPFYAVPHQNAKSGRYITGTEDVPEDMRQKAYAITKDSTVPITHSMQLNFDNIEHVNKYYFFKVLDEVANRLAEAIPGKHIFYIEDAEGEASISVSKDELMMEAFDILSTNQSKKKYYNICFFLGKDPRELSDNIMKQIIYNEAKNNPANIIRASKDTGKHQIFVNKLFMNQIITRKKNMYFYGEMMLGISLEETVLYMMDSGNRLVIDELGQRLALKEGKPLDEGPTKLEIKMIDGETKMITEDEADVLLAQYSLTVGPSYGIKGKVKTLQKNFDLIMNKNES